MTLHPLSLSSPLLTLLALAGLPGSPLPVAGLARARGVARPTAAGAVASGGAISLDNLKAYVEALGGTLTVSVTLPGR